MIKQSFCVMVLVACGHDAKPPVAPTCKPQLADLAAVYSAVAGDKRASPWRELAHTELASLASGVVADLSKMDYLEIGPDLIRVYPPVGDPVIVFDPATDLASRLRPAEGASLAIAIDTRTPWSRVEAVRAVLQEAAPAYATIGVVYMTPGALANRKPVARRNIVELGLALAEDAAAHCPAYAKVMASLGSRSIGDPQVLDDLAATLPSCSCASDFALLESVPWTLARAVTLVPIVTTPPIEPAPKPTATWGELVAANGGKPIAFSVPPKPVFVPPPPPPPPRRK